MQKPQYAQKFRAIWVTDPPFRNWLPFATQICKAMDNRKKRKNNATVFFWEITDKNPIRQRF